MESINKALEGLVQFFGATKLLSNVKNIAIVLLAWYFSQTPFDVGKIALGVVSISCIFSALYIHNNLSDRYIDRKNEQKKQYAGAVEYFGKPLLYLMMVISVMGGLITGIYINIPFVVILLALLLNGFLYSSAYTRWKEKVLLDVVSGAFLTHVLRFIGAWFIFSISLPPILAMVGLGCANMAAYIHYKNIDRPFLLSLSVKNTITLLSSRTLMIISTIFWMVTLICFLLVCLNSVYFFGAVWGTLSVKFLLLIPCFIPPLVVIYYRNLGYSSIGIRYLRVAGFVYALLVIGIVLVVLDYFRL